MFCGRVVIVRRRPQGGAQVIHLLGVHKDFTRQGTGLAMVRYAVSLTKETGMKTLRLDVLNGNSPLKSFMKKQDLFIQQRSPYFTKTQAGQNSAYTSIR